MKNKDRMDFYFSDNLEEKELSGKEQVLVNLKDYNQILKERARYSSITDAKVAIKNAFVSASTLSDLHMMVDIRQGMGTISVITTKDVHELYSRDREELKDELELIRSHATALEEKNSELLKSIEFYKSRADLRCEVVNKLHVVLIRDLKKAICKWNNSIIGKLFPIKIVFTGPEVQTEYITNF